MTAETLIPVFATATLPVGANRGDRERAGNQEQNGTALLDDPGN